MKVTRIIYPCLAAALLGVILVGCQESYHANEIQTGVPDGKFTTSVSSGFSLDLSCSDAQAIAHYTCGDMSAQVYEQPWTEASFISSTRGPVTGDEVEWANIPGISLYVTDTAETLKLRDLAFNPYDQSIYQSYQTLNSATTDPALGTVTSSKFFWDTWSAMPVTANFYGYYPRPGNGNALVNYKKVSIVSAEDARGVGTAPKLWNELNYVFLEEQTDENLSYHDIMYSVSEESVTAGRYGNRSKAAGDNIQMHFIHAFSLMEIEVDRGSTYSGNCMISEVSVSGANVFTSGKLDILNGTVTPGHGNSYIKRAITETAIEKGQPFRTAMIVQPATISSDKGEFVVSCKIDGIQYTCPLSNVKFEAGKKYMVKLTLNPTGIVIMRVWSAGKVQVGNETYSAGEYEITTVADTFTVSAETGYKLSRVLRNNAVYEPIVNDGVSYTYNLAKDNESKVYYDVIVTPSDWYSVPEELHIHFDGLQNDKYKTGTRQSAAIWSDLSGNGNDGNLKSFDLTGTVGDSGWDMQGGLKFDGLDDIVTFPGTLNVAEYTMEFYICVDPIQQKMHPRLNAEGVLYPSFYLTTVSNATSRSIRLYAHGYDTGPIEFCDFTTDGQAIVQLDFAYSSAKETLEIYINGDLRNTYPIKRLPVPISVASLGNRTQDNSRTLKATYYSYMLYDKALSEAEIKHNYEINLQRYGAQKTVAVQ